MKDNASTGQALIQASERAVEQFVSELGAVDATEAGVSVPRGLQPLQRLQARCEVTWRAPGTEGLRTPMYLLAAFLEDALANLAGDVPYSEAVAAIRREFFVGVASLISEMATAFDSSRPTTWIQPVESLLDHYATTIAQLNEHFEDEVRKSEGA